ncbi:MAG: hypothetical protein N2C12_05250 [Planctomycetales bacterium]
MSFRSTSFPLLLIGLLSLGCGSGDYETRLSVAVRNLRLEEPFNELFSAPIEFPDQGISIRIPQLFDSEKYSNISALQFDSPDPRDPTRPLDENRVQPDFQGGYIPTDGLLRTYERFYQYTHVDNKVRKSALYLYLAAVPKTGDGVEGLKDSIRNQLENAFPASPPALEFQLKFYPKLEFGVTDWVEDNIVMADGSRATVYKITAEAKRNLPKYIADDEKPAEGYLTQDREEIARYELCVYSPDNADVNVVVAWFTAYKLADESKIAELTNAVMGSVGFKAAEEEDPGSDF